MDNAKILKTLEAKRLLNIVENPDHFVVMWYEGGKVKLGRLNKRYFHRYGITTFATCTNGRFWFQSSETAQKCSQKALDFMVMFEKDPELVRGVSKAMDLSLIQLNW